MARGSDLERRRVLVCPRCKKKGYAEDFDVWGKSATGKVHYFNHQCSDEESCLMLVPKSGGAFEAEPFTLCLLTYCRKEAYARHRERAGLEPEGPISWDERHEICLESPHGDVHEFASWIREHVEVKDTRQLEKWIRENA